MSQKIKTPIYFTDEEARQYAAYLEEKENIDAILWSNILKTKSAQGIMHFDKDSVIQLIERTNEALYRRKKI